MRFIGIDPSTKTGLVILDRDGNMLDCEEITSKDEDPYRMIEIIERVSGEIEPNDVVAIEGFGFASQSGFILGGIGWGMRMELSGRDIKYIEVAPNALKKFASGKGTAKKDALAVEIYKRWGFEHHSDDVRDAYVLAQIARAVKLGTATAKYQQEVVQAILAPPKAKGKKGKVANA